MKIRPLKESEVKAVSEIVGLNFSKQYEILSRREIRAMFKNYESRPNYLVAEDRGEILGFCGYIQSWFDYHIYEIFWVNVSPKHQNKGIGTTLVKRAIQIIKNNRGNDKAFLILLSTNTPRFYEKIGFKTISKFKKSYLMALSLSKN